jgi:osmotically-inducible protein OsmY
VNVIDGLVTITGEVFSPLERERASQLIRSVPGVIDVQNELTVRPPE